MDATQKKQASSIKTLAKCNSQQSSVIKSQAKQLKDLQSQLGIGRLTFVPPRPNPIISFSSRSARDEAPWRQSKMPKAAFKENAVKEKASGQRARAHEENLNEQSALIRITKIAAYRARAERPEEPPPPPPENHLRSEAMRPPPPPRWPLLPRGSAGCNFYESIQVD